MNSTITNETNSTEFSSEASTQTTTTTTNPTETTSQDLMEFFYAISTDPYGKIGSNYVNHERAIKHFLTLTPEQFHVLYERYYTQTNFVSSNPSQVKDTSNTDDNPKFYWLCDNTRDRLRCIREIYEELKKKYTTNQQLELVLDERPLTYRFALILWLYIYH